VVITPYTENSALILKGAHLELLSPDGRERRPISSLKGREAGRGLIVKIKNITTREAAQGLKGWSLIMARPHLPAAADDEVYWADLIGLAVSTPDGRELGLVTNLMEAGAGLILVVSDPSDGRERLLPFQEQFIVSLDLPGRRLALDPPPGLLDL
jgi:16S rRNA processing protein RimM